MHWTELFFKYKYKQQFDSFTLNSNEWNKLGRVVSRLSKSIVGNVVNH